LASDDSVQPLLPWTKVQLVSWCGCDAQMQ
jgi:hypothetical protein